MSEPMIDIADWSDRDEHKYGDGLCRCGQLLDAPGDRWCLRCEKLREDEMQERCSEEE